MDNNFITLANGLRVANFSSPHPFVFDSGETLPGVDAATAKTCMADAVEVSVKGDPQWSPAVPVTNILISFHMNDILKDIIAGYQTSFEQNEVDVVLISLPTMTALKEDGYDILRSPFRVCRMADRVKKTICSDKFCI